jgi:hypothetical protein
MGDTITTPARKRGPKKKPPCDVDSCGRPHYGRGYCSGHYQRIVLGKGKTRAGLAIGEKLAPAPRKPRCPERVRASNLKQSFGIALQLYDEMLMTQCGLCAVCGEPERVNKFPGREGVVLRLSVHHDHTTGKVIALLCSSCNLAMGMLRDDPALLRRAADIHEGM